VYTSNAFSHSGGHAEASPTRRTAQQTPRLSAGLAAILAAAIAGSSTLMGGDAEAIVHDLKAHQSVILPMIAKHGGRIIDTAGDGISSQSSAAS